MLHLLCTAIQNTLVSFVHLASRLVAELDSSAKQVGCCQCGT